MELIPTKTQGNWVFVFRLFYLKSVLTSAISTENMFSTLFGATKTSTSLNKGVASVDPAPNLGIVQEVLECPVCYNVPDEAPVYQCENGHLVSISPTQFYKEHSKAKLF